MRLKVLHPAFIEPLYTWKKRLAQPPSAAHIAPTPLQFQLRGREGNGGEGQGEKRGGEGNEEGEGSGSGGREGEWEGRGEKTEWRGKGVPLIALCDKYHPGYNLNVHGI